MLAERIKQCFVAREKDIIELNTRFALCSFFFFQLISRYVADSLKKKNVVVECHGTEK